MDAQFDFGDFLRSLPQPQPSSTQAQAAADEQATSDAVRSPSNPPGQAPRQMSGVRQTVAPSGLNSVSSNTGMSVEDKLAARAYSGAANALAAAAAAAATSRTAHDSPAVASEGAGVRINDNIDTFEYDVAQHKGEQKSELKVTPVTLIRTEPFFEMQQRIAVNHEFICYSLKAGQVRVLHKQVSARSLLKGASHPPAVKFPSNSCNRLASADKSGQVVIWDISHETPDINHGTDDTVNGCLSGTFILSSHPGPPNAAHTDGTPVSQAQVACHAAEGSQPVLAMAMGQTLYLAALDESEQGSSQPSAPQWDCTDLAALPLSSMTSLQLPHTVRYLAFSLSGHNLAAVNSADQVVVWSLPGPGQISKDTTLQTLVQFQPDPQSTCNTVHWLSPATLVVGCANNSIISLWHISDTAECLQTVKLVSNMQSGSSDAYLHMVVQPEAGIVILADAKSPVVYALHINSTADNAKFDYLAEFVVGQPILSLAADYTPSEDPNVLQLFCVQEKAIQLYTLNLAQCEPALLPTVPSSVLSEAASALQMPHRDSQPSTPAASNRQADPLSSSHQQPSTLATPGGQAEALSASDQQQSLQEAAGSLPALPLPISTPPASSLPDQPKLLTPKHLMQHTTRSASQTSMSSMTGQVTPKTESAPLNQVLDALAPRAASLHRPAGSNLPGLRGQIDNSDAVSSTSMQGSLLTPGDLSRPASALSGSTVPRSAATLDAELKQEQKQKSPGASPAGSRSSTPPPTTPAMPSAAYLTPEQYNGEPASPTPPADAAAAAATEAASPTGSAAEDSSRQLFAEGPPDGAASPDQVPGSNKVLQKRQEATESSQRLGNGNDPSSAFDQPLDMLPVASAAPVSPPPGLPQTQVVSDDGSVSQQQQSQQQAQPQHRQEQLQSQQQVQHQQPSALSLQSPAAVLSQQVELSDLSARRIVDAVAERTLAQHKRMLSHLHDGHREMLRIIKADISKEGKRLQAAIEAQVSQMSKSQNSLVAEDRRVVLAEQQACMERLVNLISASINRDLPLRMEGIVRAEVAVLSNGLQQQLSPVLQTAVAEALPDQFASPQLRNALEASLNSQLQQALAKPLQESFTSSFQQQLIPAFEGACRDMFAQVQATFAGGLSEHLQAAGGANASVAASLRESLGTAAQLVTDLKTDLQEGQNSLLQLASQRSGRRGSGFGNEEAQQDPRQEYMALIREQKYEEAFHRVLSLEDISMVAWLCSQLDPGSLLSQNPPMLNQQILLPLIQQLGVDLSEDTLTKLKWIQSTALALNPQDPFLAPHVRPILDHLYRSLQQVLTGSSSREAANQAQICLHLVNSLLHSCSA